MVNKSFIVRASVVFFFIVKITVTVRVRQEISGGIDLQLKKLSKELTSSYEVLDLTLEVEGSVNTFNLKHLYSHIGKQ